MLNILRQPQLIMVKPLTFDSLKFQAFQEELNIHQSQLASVLKHFEQVQAHASLEGQKVLNLRQDSVRNSWK